MRKLFKGFSAWWAGLAEPLPRYHDKKGGAEEKVGEIGKQYPAGWKAENSIAGLVHKPKLRKEAEKDIGIARDYADDNKHPGHVPRPRPQQDREKGSNRRDREARH